MNTKITSIKTNESTFIQQDIVSTSTHTVTKQYQILSKNDFGKVPNRINVGAFNKKNNIIVSENESILIFDSLNNSIKTTPITDILQNPKRYFLIYKYIFDTKKTSEFLNDSLNFESIHSGENYVYNLTKESGELLGLIIKEISIILNIEDPNTINIQNILLKYYSEEESSKLSLIFKNIININNRDKIVNINKNIIINSNPEFILGFLRTFFDNNKYFRIPRGINIYIFSTMLNLLGASYSIRSSNIPDEIKKDYPFIIRFKLPYFLKNYNNDLDTELFRKYKFMFLPKKYGDNKDFELKYFHDISRLEKLNLRENQPDKNIYTDFQEQVNIGNIELIPCIDVIFRELTAEEKEEKLYDLTMENQNADNFWLAGNPWFKNSDGDIMAVFGIYTKEATEEADKKFSPRNKEKFINLQNGEIFNWGVQHDGQSGIWNATK